MIVHFHIQHHAGTNLFGIVRRNQFKTGANSEMGHDTREPSAQYDHPIVGPPGLPWIKPDPSLSPEQLEQRWLDLGIDWAQIEMPLNKTDNMPWGSTQIDFTVVMRHPMHRILSNTHYPRDGFPEMLERGDYTRWVTRGGDHNDNFALRWFVGKPSQEGAVTGDDLAEAKRRLEKFDVIMIQEWFPESGRLLRDVLGWRDCDFGPRKARKSVRERINNDALYDSIVTRLKYDIELYEYAKDLATQRWGKPEPLAEEVVGDVGNQPGRLEHLSTVPHRAPGLHSRSVGDQLILRRPGKTQEFALNSSARMIWDQLDGTRSIWEIATVLSERHSIDTQKLNGDVREAIVQLVKRGLVEPRRRDR